MFTAVEFDYLKSIINTYISQGYKYYVAHTITENNNDYDLCIYFSKNEIIATTNSRFIIPDGSIVVYVDSSSRNDNNFNPSVHSRTSLNYFHGQLSINIAEFIFTNANNEYVLTTDVLNPDIIYNVNTFENRSINYAILFVLIAIFLFNFIKSILRLRR